MMQHSTVDVNASGNVIEMNLSKLHLQDSQYRNALSLVQSRMTKESFTFSASELSKSSAGKKFASVIKIIRHCIHENYPDKPATIGTGASVTTVPELFGHFRKPKSAM